MRLNSFFPGVVFLLVILSGCSRDDGVPVDESIAVDVPDSFARFFNPVAGLPAGDYTIVAATVMPNRAGNFTVTVTFDSGEKQVFNGSWTDSAAGAGMNQLSFNNPSFDFTLTQAGGVDITLESGEDAYLILLSRAAGTNGNMNRNGQILGFNNDFPGFGTNSRITLLASRLDSEAYAEAYYTEIDPDSVKTTLEDWKVANGYYDALAGDPDYSAVVNARFRDTKDLGYGRGMRVWTNLTDGSFYAFVENFQVAVIPGQEYSLLNLEALLNDDRQYHFGSNAIEFSTYPYGNMEPSDIGSTTRFAKFYSFDATQADPTPGTQDHVNETRLNLVNLDGRGDLSMPGACVYCHGGSLKPLLTDGTFSDNVRDGSGADGNGLKGDTNAKLQLIEVNSLEFGSASPFTESEQEAFLKQINQAIYCTYPNPVDVVTPGYCSVQPPDPTPVNTVSGGMWSADFAREMAEGWYDDTNVAGLFDSPTFIEDFVPVGWRPDAGTGNPPPGADQLFLKAVGPNCFICHSRRGEDIDTSDSENEHIDFSTYEKFVGDAELIKQYVFEQGVMPLSLRGYTDFWSDDEAPVIMASFLNGVLAADNQISLNSDGGIDEPGASVADAGPDRSTSSPTRLSGANSRFVDSYLWNIVSTPVGGEMATLTNANTAAPLLTAAVDGDYVIRLTSSNGRDSDSDTVTISINSVLMPDPKDIVFSDIEAIFDADCATTCHVTGGTYPGIPVFWTVAQPMGTTRYEEVLARVNFKDPTKSRILTKPAGEHHYGNLRPGFDTNNPADRQNYDLFLNWILEGAREN